MCGIGLPSAVAIKRFNAMPAAPIGGGSGGVAGACHHLCYGIRLSLPSGNEQYFVSRRITEDVIDVRGAIKLIEARPAPIRASNKARSEQHTELRHLFRSVLPQVFDDWR